MIYLPERCLRDLPDCEPLSQIEADDGDSFICCGLNDPASRIVAGDRFRLCWKNEVIDEMTDWDERDLIDTISVMAQALSADANMRNSEEA